MDLHFTRKDKKVVIEISEGPLDFTFNFEFECGSNWSAELLRAHYSKKFWKAIQEIRKLEYERGYKVGRGKQKKDDWWKANLDPREY